MSAYYCAECGSPIANISLQKCGTFQVVGHACCPEHATKACARIEQYQIERDPTDTYAIVAWHHGTVVADAEGAREEDAGLSYVRNAHTCVGGEGE